MPAPIAMTLLPSSRGRRSELAVLHEETLSRLRPWLERDGKTLQ